MSTPKFGATGEFPAGKPEVLWRSRHNAETRQMRGALLALVGVFLFGVVAGDEPAFGVVVRPIEIGFSLDASRVSVNDGSFDRDISPGNSKNESEKSYRIAERHYPDWFALWLICASVPCGLALALILTLWEDRAERYDRKRQRNR